MNLSSSTLSLLLIASLGALTIVGCDSSGSNDSSPAWVGGWEVTSFNGSPTPEDNFLDLSTEKFTAIEPAPDGCDILTFDIIARDGNTVTIDIPEGSEKDMLDVSDGTLTVTVLETDDPDSDPGDELTAESVDNPRSEAGC